MVRWLLTGIVLWLPVVASAASCDVIDTTYGIYTGEGLTVDKGVEINGNVVDEDVYAVDTGLQVGGDTETGSVTIPALDPPSFPANSSSTVLSEDDSPLDGTAEVFIETINVGKNSAFSFTGSGPFHIDELIAESGATLNFSPGTYFINTFNVEKNTQMIVSSQVRIHIGAEFIIDKDADLNAGGAPEDLLIFLHEDSILEAGKNADIAAAIVGSGNQEILLDKGVSFAGVILSDGEVELGKDVSLTLSPSQQISIGDESTCEATPGSAADHIVISHDNNGIHCLDEIITFSVVEADGAAVEDYEAEITLNTQSGFGSFTLESGLGTFVDATANDGLATYTFSAADDGVVSVRLSYTEGTSSIDIDAYETANPALRDDDTEAALTFAPSGFTVTDSLLSNPPPATINDPLQEQQAGSDFSIFITAYGVTPTDTTCGVIEAYDGNQSLSFWMDYANPSTGSVVATVNTVAISSNEAGAVAQTVNFSSGQVEVTAKYKDVGQIQIEMKDGAIRGATAPFVVYPADIVVTSVTDSLGVANPIASTMTGDAFVVAGELFSVTVQVRDAEGSLTPNFGNETIAEGIKITAASLVAPVSGFNGSANDGAIDNAQNFVPISPVGTFRNTAASWDEIGVIQLQASIADTDYLGTDDVSGTVSGNVGRFTPDSFVLDSSAVAGYCANSTYMGQGAMAVSYQVEARGLGGNKLQNYDLGLLGSAVVSSVGIVAENNDTGGDLGGRLSLSSTTWVNGALSLASSSEAFDRLASPDGPYSSLQLGLKLTDPVDNLVLSALDMKVPGSGDCTITSDCDAKKIGNTTEVVYGRLEVLNAFGSETEALDVQLRMAARQTSGEFALHVSDSCTTYVDSGAALGNYQNGLPAVTVIAPSIATAFSSGVSAVGSGILLSSPGATNTGSVDVTYDAPSWLEYDWSGMGPEDPTGTAIFGQFRGHDKMIYWREVY